MDLVKLTESASFFNLIPEGYAVIYLRCKPEGGIKFVMEPHREFSISHLV
jgi:hypothetical protein